MRVSLRQIGQGMVQQIQSACPACKGQGTKIDERDKCKSCKGSKVVKNRKELVVNIEKGMQNGQKIKFTGDADEMPGTYPGDVVIVLQLKEHETFKRKGADLLTEMELTLSEALCGFTKTITHLDGRVLKIVSNPGKVVRHGEYKSIPDEGMPQHGNIFNKGGLFVHFTIKFPVTLPLSQVEAIKKVLPDPPAVMLSGEEEEVDLEEVDVTLFGRGAGGGKSAHAGGEDEDDDEKGGQRVQCGQN